MRHALLIVALAACKGEPSDTGPFEGDDAGECSDGADNDRDGAFDCLDVDCEFSPACTGGEADTDTDADADSDSDSDSDADSDADADADSDADADTGSCTNDLCGLTSVNVSYTYQLTVIGLGSCTQVFSGTGALVEAHDDWARFYGTWERSSSNCAAQFDDIIWHDVSGEGYHTFEFHPNRVEVLEWYVHRSSSDHLSGALRYYITEMYEGIDLSIAQPTFSHQVQDGDPFTQGNHNLNVTFN